MKQPWLILAAAVASGCFLADRVPLAFSMVVLTVIFIGIVWMTKKRYGLAVLLAAASVLYATEALEAPLSDGESVRLAGVVTQSKEGYYDVSSGFFKSTRILSPTRPAVGETVAVSGIYLPPEAPKNPGGFDERHYMLAHRIAGTIRASKEEVVRGEKTTRAFLYRLRGRWQRYGTKVFKSYFPRREATILSSMLYGTDADWSELGELDELNLLHILSISGLHIGLIVALLKKIARVTTAPIRAAKPLIHALTLFYLFLTSFPVGGMRVFFSLVFIDIGKALKSPVDPVYALSFSACVFLLFNPFLIYHMGFWFSFLSVYAILCIYPRWTRLDERATGILKGIGVSSAITIMIVPLLSRLSGRVSVMSVAANVVILPLAGLLLYGGIALSILHPLFSQIAAGIALIMNALFSVFAALVEAFAAHAWSIPLPNFTISDALVYYGVILLASYFPFRYLTKKAGTILTVQAASMMVLALAYGHMPREDLQITQLYVGQGDCALIESRDLTALIDTGGSAFGGDPAKYYVLPVLRHKNISKLDAVFISHYDADHMQGIFTVAESCKIRRVFGPKSEDAEDLAMRRAVSREVCEVETVSGKFPLDRWNLTIYPPFGASGNESSMAMRLESNGASALYLGDLPAREEEELAEIAGHATVIKLAHHGSKTSTSEALLAAAQPKLAMISAGEHNRYGHPHPEVLERLCDLRIPYLETKDGAISLTFKDGKIDVEVYRGDKLSIKDCIIFTVDVIFLVATAWRLSIYVKERRQLWNQFITVEPTSCTDRKSTVWSRSGLNSKNAI
ncbi:MAG: DNA internalization-related competence protein ComEC/Rec2 [Peptoniphilus sp.]|nr:DNA internalization-related competence protein ComEC/Rec2 [Peptoniphilus sp.]MDD7362763.1 DNA internalization-related competence protein ComEC/Rec2 [Bacillota bacterium]MDY6044543.1 DNA internalization-related competence protein ComEC/Rec2 [Peptoniphilus sp.]